ncbi:PREDICTED: uncharacterized protein LOC106749398 [Dinoponera quadriceps]|uniref:Uncharacterized protein LOC106749398 n=1 Tax=Dinoponera quadriceps TaxID=609295 RepID=A0A6P3Y1V6_DINQU|nr:PREDICTED: uncharacterized protein LOC106749398 [Dinoponera quadriceps]
MDALTSRFFYSSNLTARRLAANLNRIPHQNHSHLCPLSARLAAETAQNLPRRNCAQRDLLDFCYRFAVQIAPLDFC